MNAALLLVEMFTFYSFGKRLKLHKENMFDQLFKHCEYMAELTAT